jgi:hypothetical protein
MENRNDMGKAMLAKVDQEERRAQQQKEAAIPEVGIIFCVPSRRGGDLWIESTPIDEAGEYGDFKIHENDHLNYWEKLCKEGFVPVKEYDEVPRGRVVYDTSRRIFTLFLDRCILKNDDLVKRIMRCMHLPNTTKIETDAHYRCPHCLRNKTSFSEL